MDVNEDSALQGANGLAAAENPKSKYKYNSEIQQMMYVCGEKNDPLPDTVMLIEDIVRGQVIELFQMASKLASTRGSRVPTPEDFIFLIRKDKTKVNRLISFLAWKDVRKNTKESGAPEVEDDLLEDGQDKEIKAKQLKIKLPWELIHNLTEAFDSDPDDEEVDEETAEIMMESLQRLKTADEETQKMSKDEYVHYSECRQASFTYRKGKKFRDWCHLGTLIDTKTSDDLIDIMGFLTFEMVATLTETAINLKKSNMSNSKSEKKGPLGLDVPVVCSLFAPPPGTQAPLEVSDIQQAFRHLQLKHRLPLRNFRAGLVQSRVILF
ncbi:Transcription initiation protein spt3 [Entomophthora muscae]|uniref:Transcription initiation protein spt3 n=2 Tax=Entomophthora muscae TaxID=34485 RepID=A0ACC2UH81_9FUNG|nr:Transcription initiation protein spt3 [Entomophthora muscae]KAJ9085742.1 Transcription initiation protein spt3 [Entomophthora muscae]